MTKHLIYIYTDQKENPRGYKVGNKSLTVKVTETKPYDTSSNRFKKVTHTIQYPQGVTYNSSEYSIEIYDPYAHFHKYLLKYSQPKSKMNSIDLFFQFSDGENRYPLVLGFNQDSGTLYYTAGFLYSFTFKWLVYVYINDYLPYNKSFSSRDLLTRLLEELGIYVTDRKEKLVIRLGEKPSTISNITYPESGHYPKKITVSKSTDSSYPGYDKYTHTIDQTSNVESFYVSFDKDSLFMYDNRDLKRLKTVDVYYNKTKDQIPILIVFTFERGQKIYKYADFSQDLTTTPGKSKKICDLQDFNGFLMRSILVEQTRKVNKEITFKTGSREDQNISEQTGQIGENNQFTKVTLTPNTDESRDGKESGPWEVYNDKLFKKEPNLKIDPSFLSGFIEKTFTEINVYYSKENKALLVEFQSADKTFFKRQSKDGKSWKKEEKVDSIDQSRIIQKLIEIETIVTTVEEKIRAPEAQRQEDGPNEKNTNTSSQINLGTTLGIVGGVVVVILGGSGGGGYWLYKRRSVRNRILL